MWGGPSFELGPPLNFGNTQFKGWVSSPEDEKGFMDNSLKRRVRARLARVRRVRKQLRGTQERPRLTVSKTNCHIYAQLVDDDRETTLAGYGTQSKSFSLSNRVKSKEAARIVGAEIARIARQKNIDTVVFDRGRYKFHGIIAELANAAREAGLRF